MGIPGVEYFAHPWVLGPRLRQGGPVHRGAVRRPARLRAGHGQPGGAARGTGRGDVRAGGADRHDARVRPGAGQAGGEPVRGPDGHAAGHGLACSACTTWRTRTTPRCPATRWPAMDARAMKQARRMQRGTDGSRPADFRAEVRDWLRAHVPAAPLPSVDTAEGFARHREWERELAAARLSVVSWPRRVRRPGRVAAGLAGLRGGVLRRRPRPVRVGQNGIFLLAPTLLRARHRRAAGPAAAADGPGRRGLGAGLVGAGGGQRPGRDPGPRGRGPTAAGCCPGPRPGARGRRSPTRRSACSA